MIRYVRLTIVNVDKFRTSGVIPYRDASWCAVNAATAATAKVFHCARSLAVNNEVTFIDVEGSATALLTVFRTAFAEAIHGGLRLHPLAHAYTGGELPDVQLEDFGLWTNFDDRYVDVRRNLAEPVLTNLLVDFVPTEYTEADITVYMNGVDRTYTTT